MRGRDDRDECLFSYVRLEQRVLADHPMTALQSPQVLILMFLRLEQLAVARSNPCLEFWLIPHCEDFPKSEGRKAVRKPLQKLGPEFDPNGGKFVEAAAWINTLDTGKIGLWASSNNGSPCGPPSIIVHRLTPHIRGTSP